MPIPPPPAPGEPFVLLDDARDHAGQETSPPPARLYRAPAEIVVARRPEEVAPALARIEALSRAGQHLAGYLAYEAGLALEPRLTPLASVRTGADGPLLWFGAFQGYQELDGDMLATWLASGSGLEPGTISTIGPLDPQLSPGGYAQQFAGLHEAIAAGDIYQANFTLPLAGAWRGDPLAIYAGLRSGAGAGHGGIVHDGQHWLLSLSPELFVEVEGEHVTGRPMKGTRPRGATPEQDAAQARALAESVKDRAENLMIVDLMRNDLSRIAVPGSVRVEAPFAVETYPTVHQMVSTVRARLRPGLGLAELIRALFPCGSITGAPKIRAMELIDRHERDPRGIYCGAIGRIDPAPARTARAKPTGGAAFNVAIRTLRLSPDHAGAGKAVLGVGSAIVADSAALPEWRECLIKGGFVNQPVNASRVAGGMLVAGLAQFDLIETLGFTPEHGIPLLDLHLERIGASALALGFAFDRHAARNAIQALCFEAEAPSRLRLLLARSGATCLEIGALPPPMARAPGEPVVCAVLPLPLDAGDWRLAHKTSDRALHDAGLEAARQAGAEEALFIRDDGLLTEGSRTNLFVERDGKLLTPPARLGLLPGVLRRHLLETGRAIEAELTLDDLAGGFLLGNALRGLMSARLLDTTQ